MTDTATPSRHSILLVDDDRFLLDMYAKKFSDEGYDVNACMSVQDAVSALEGGFNAAVIVFDLVMPQQDGFELLRLLNEKKLGEKAVKVVLTNQSAEEEQAKVEALGADAYIVKATMIPTEVFNRIKELLNGEKHA